jgi:hypothetical protein
MQNGQVVPDGQTKQHNLISHASSLAKGNEGILESDSAGVKGGR